MVELFGFGVQYCEKQLLSSTFFFRGNGGQWQAALKHTLIFLIS